MKHRINRLHIPTLTIIAIGITVAAAVAVSMLSFITVYNRSLMRDASVSSEQAVQQTGNAVSNYISGMRMQVDRVSTEIASCESLDEVTDCIDMAVRLQSDIASVLVYSTDGVLLASGSDNWTLKGDLSHNLSYDADAFAATEGYSVLKPHVQTLFDGHYPWVVTVAHREYQPLLGGDVYVAVDFSFNGIAQYVDNVGIGNHGYCYIIDGDGEIVYHPQQQLIFAGLKSEDIDSVISAGDGVHIGNGEIDTLFSLPDSAWRIVGISFTDELVQTRTKTAVNVILLSFFCCAVVAVLIIMLFSRIVARPVRELADAMQAFERDADTYRYSPRPGRVAELQTLSDSFGHMVCMVQELMERVKAEEVTLRKTELRALQAQINPHFLYNTLDSIQWMCEQGRDDDAVRMVGALGSLFRISISRGHELIPIKDELRHVESYLIIQSYRYKNRFTYRIEADDGIKDCLCNKITVQPLVENAIYHGIEPLVDEGEITISVRPDGNDILIQVRDNGVGMTPEQCNSILNKERSDSSGIGIKNVNDRLRIYFGEKYGISIDSELDCGTTISVRIPQIRKEPEDK